MTAVPTQPCRWCGKRIAGAHTCKGPLVPKPPKNTDPWPLTQCIDWDCERAWDEQGEPDGYWRCGTCPYCLATPESADPEVAE